MQLTAEQQRTLDAAGEVPARIADSGGREVLVLLRADDFDWIRGLLNDEPDAPRASDPRSGTSYALVPEARYERFKAFFEEDPVTRAERQELLREFGRRAGWDDPVWDEPDGGGARP